MRSSHCVVILQVVNSKRPSLSRTSQDTIRAKTNSYLDKIKGETGGLEDIEKQQMTFSKFHLFPLSSPASALPSPSFPLTHLLMVIYLVGKGFAFSPERDRQQDVSES